MGFNIFLVAMGAFNVGSRFIMICDSLAAEAKPRMIDWFFLTSGLISIVIGAVAIVTR